MEKEGEAKQFFKKVKRQLREFHINHGISVDHKQELTRKDQKPGPEEMRCRLRLEKAFNQQDNIVSTDIARMLRDTCHAMQAAADIRKDISVTNGVKALEFIKQEIGVEKTIGYNKMIHHGVKKFREDKHMEESIMNICNGYKINGRMIKSEKVTALMRGFQSLLKLIGTILYLLRFLMNMSKDKEFERILKKEFSKEYDKATSISGRIYKERMRSITQVEEEFDNYDSTVNQDQLLEDNSSLTRRSDRSNKTFRRQWEPEYKGRRSRSGFTKEKLQT
ncbi:hypothetical protein DINM_006920 [Dirofilaria immitis]|nr:hypothetical protein [Dirofilaria immitis]